eukprot:scaffold83567_cov54-Phaeocystis_antarctica.AAC.1
MALTPPILARRSRQRRPVCPVAPATTTVFTSPSASAACGCWLMAASAAAPSVNSRRPNAEATGAARRRGADVVTAGRRGAAVKACTRWRAASMGTGSTALGVGVVRYLLRKYTHGVAMRTWSRTARRHG